MHRRVIKAVDGVRGARLARSPYATGASKGEALVFGDQQTEALRRPFVLKQGRTLFFFSKGEGSEVGEHSAQRANMPGSGSAHLRTPFEALSRVNRSRVASLVPFSFQCSPFSSSVGAVYLL